MTNTPGPGLDLTALRALRGRRTDHTHLLERVAAHLEHHDGYVSLSGGKDSVAVLDLARQADPAVPVVWFDSGLEYPETHTYLTELADRWNLNLHVITATPNALEILTTSGAWNHTAPDQHTPSLSEAIIDAPAALAHDAFGPGVLWGVRAAESHGRHQLYATQLHREIAVHCTGCCTRRPRAVTSEQRRRHGGVVRRTDGTVAYSPIWDWDSTTVLEYLAAHQIPPNPVYAKLQALGAPERAQRVSHVIDAAHLHRGRVTWLRRGWPELYEQLRQALPRIDEYL